MSSGDCSSASLMPGGSNLRIQVTWRTSRRRRDIWKSWEGFWDMMTPTEGETQPWPVWCRAKVLHMIGNKIPKLLNKWSRLGRLCQCENLSLSVRVVGGGERFRVAGLIKVNGDIGADWWTRLLFCKCIKWTAYREAKRIKSRLSG